MRMTPAQKWNFATTYRGHRVAKICWSFFALCFFALGIAMASVMIELALLTCLIVASGYAFAAVREQNRINSMFAKVSLEDLKPLTETKLQEAA